MACHHRGVRVLLAPTGLDPLPPSRVTAALAAGWARQAPHDDLVARPLAAGGSGTLDALGALRTAERMPLSVPGVGPVPVVRLGGAAWLESAAVAGDAAGSSAPLGATLAALLEGGASRIVVGLGAARTRDAGMGLLGALGPGGRLLDGPDALAGLADADVEGLGALRQRWSGPDLVAAYDDELPLLGLGGMSALLAPDPQTGQDRERAVAHAARLAVAAVGRSARLDLLSGGSPVQRLASAPGSGAAGGLGFALGLLGARLLPGADVVVQAVDLADELAAADLAVVAVPQVDGHVLHSGVVPAVAERAAAAGVPVVVLAHRTLVGRRDLAAAGLAGCYLTSAVAAPGATPPDVRDGATSAALVEALAERVARTWSPR